MKVTVEGNAEQVAATLNPSLLEHPSPRTARLKENKAKREEFIARRGIVLDAFKKVRYSEPDQAALLLEALRRTTGVTDADLEIARNILNSPS